MNQSENTQDHYATCNGCGVGMTESEISYQNDDGHDYCKNCNEAIQSDDESSGRMDEHIYSHNDCLSMLEYLRQRCAEEAHVVSAGGENWEVDQQSILSIDLTQFIQK